jgi:hypothetical protein
MKNLFHNYQQFKTTSIGLLILAGSSWFLYNGKITGTEFFMLLPTVLILLGINDKAFKKTNEKE